MIKENVTSILSSIPKGILLVAASKTRTPEEVSQAIEAGISVLGYNYIQEAEQMHRIIGDSVRWHLIGHLQSNKAKRAVQLCASCVVKAECLAYALNNNEKFGVWGGFTVRRRRKLRRVVSIPCTAEDCKKEIYGETV